MYREIPVTHLGGPQATPLSTGIDAASAALGVWAKQRQTQQEEDAAAAKLVPYLQGLDQKSQSTLMAKLAQEQPSLFQKVAAHLAPAGPDPMAEFNNSNKYALAGYDPTTKKFAPLPTDPGAAALMISNRRALGIDPSLATAAPAVAQTNVSTMAPAEQQGAIRIAENTAPTANVVTTQTAENLRNATTNATTRRGQDIGATTAANQVAAQRDIAGNKLKADAAGASTLSDYSKKAIAEIDPLLKQAAMVIDKYAPYKDKNNLLTDRDLASYATYRAGGALPESDPMSAAAPLSMLNVSAAARILKGGSRSMQALMLAKQHTPNPTGTRASIYQRSVQMYNYLKNARDAAIAEGGDVTAADATASIPTPQSWANPTGGSAPQATNPVSKDEWDALIKKGHTEKDLKARGIFIQ